MKDCFGATPKPARETRALPENFATLNAVARLHEYQGKAILAGDGFKIPRGRAASNADEAVAAAKELGSEVVVKIQAWTTGRAGIGGVAFAKKLDESGAVSGRSCTGGGKGRYRPGIFSFVRDR
jgi:hypothetical protein